MDRKDRSIGAEDKATFNASKLVWASEVRSGAPEGRQRCGDLSIPFDESSVVVGQSRKAANLRSSAPNVGVAHSMIDCTFRGCIETPSADMLCPRKPSSDQPNSHFELLA